MKRTFKNTRGITLVALVITIIILLILSGISISALTNQGIFGKAQEAKKASEIANIKEQIQLAIYEKQLINTGNISEQELKDILEKHGTIEYETDNKTIKGIKTEKGYEILLADIYSGGTTEDTKKLLADGSWNSGKNVNSPKLMEGMTGVYWDASGNEVEVTVDNQDNWYDYTNKKWANAITKDSNGKTTGYWVWIPRYEYKITTPYTNTASTITVKFIPQTQTTVDSNYTYIHPSFRNGSKTASEISSGAIPFGNGEWDAEIPGFWVAKYPAGFQANTITNNNGTLSTNISNSSDTIVYSNANYHDYNSSYATNAISQSLSSKPKMSYPVFKPLTYAYNNISTGDIHTLAKEIKNGSSFYGLNASKTDSHQMKNSEWGAVAYLTQSSCGRSGTEVNMNNYYTSTSSPYRTAVTGVYANSTGTSSTTTLGKAYNETTIGVKGSSTGNISGVYDLNGCVWEYTAGYISNSYTSTYGSSYASTSSNTNGYQTLSTKYATVYPWNSSESNANNYNRYLGLKSGTYGYGDAILETSSTGSSSSGSWNADYSYFPYSSSPFFIRGGVYGYSSGAGVFAFTHGDGGPYFSHRFPRGFGRRLALRSFLEPCALLFGT